MGAVSALASVLLVSPAVVPCLLRPRHIVLAVVLFGTLRTASEFFAFYLSIAAVRKSDVITR